MTITVTTGSSVTTWTISLPCNGDLPSDEPCDWHEMHHTDEDGRHWCPTGYAFCHTHAGLGNITGPGACHLWGEHPPSEAT